MDVNIKISVCVCVCVCVWGGGGGGVGGVGGGREGINFVMRGRVRVENMEGRQASQILEGTNVLPVKFIV